MHARLVQFQLTPMSTDTPPAKSGLNVTAIIIAAMVCLTAIVLAFLFIEPAGRAESTVKGVKSDARPPLPFFVVFKETGAWRGHWKVANIWAKPEATLPIKLDEAVLGAKIRMPTAEGMVSLSIPPGTASGKMFRLKGRGFRKLDGTRGDQLVTLMIYLPSDPTELARLAGVLSDSNVRENLSV